MPDISEVQKKAFDFAADLTKQLITLSTSIVTLTMVFGEKVPTGSWLAFSAWILFLLSTLAGLVTLMTLTGTLAPAAPSDQDSYDLKLNVRVPSGVQIALFLAAILCSILFVAFWFHPAAK